MKGGGGYCPIFIYVIFSSCCLSKSRLSKYDSLFIYLFVCFSFGAVASF